MRRFSTVALAGSVIVAVLALFPRVAHTQQAVPQPWGTFVWLTHTPTGDLPSLLTLHQDGTVAVSSSNMFGGSSLSLGQRTTALQGVWAPTGPKTIGGTSLDLVFDAGTNLLIGFGRARTQLIFTDFDHFEGTLFLDFLACPTPSTCPDPQDPSAAWTAAVPGVPSFSVSGRRLQRVEVGAL
jgi:hypothetical protein